MSKIIATTCCQKLTTKCLSGNLYDPKEAKDTIISKLNSKIVKMEQQEKDYDLLNQEFKQLENDFILLNEAKLRLEYELKQRNEAYNKRICDLKSENENLQDALNDKMCVNKKLFEEKQCLENQLKNKNAEIDDLNNKLNNSNNRLNATENDKNDLQNTLRNLNDIKLNQDNKIADLIDDNKRLAKTAQENDHNLYLNAQEKLKLNKKLSDDNANINNLNSKLRTNCNTLNNLQTQLDNSNVLNLKLQNNLKDLDNTLNTLTVDNDNLKNGLCQERMLREEEDKKNEHLRCILGDRQNKLRLLNNDYICLKNGNDKMNQRREVLQNENEKLKSHIMCLTKQNQNLSNEIDNIIKEDMHMKDVLNRSDRMSSLLQTNDTIINQMPQDELSYTACFEEKRSCIYPQNKLCFSQTMTRDRSFSPKYTYTRSEQI